MKKLLFIVNLIRHDFFLWKLFHLWNTPTISVDCECKGVTAVGNLRSITFPYMWVYSILGNSLCNSNYFCFQIHFVIFYRSGRKLQRTAGWQPLCYKQSPYFTQKFQKKVSLFLPKKRKNSLFVKTTALPITTIRRVLYPFVNVTLYYLEKLRTCYINWRLFISPINTWTVFIPCSSTYSAENLLQRVETCLTICREQSPLSKETEEWTKCRVLQKRGSWEKSLNSIWWVLSKRTNQRRPVVLGLQKELKSQKD